MANPPKFPGEQALKALPTDLLAVAGLLLQAVESGEADPLEMHRAARRLTEASQQVWLLLRLRRDLTRSAIRLATDLVKSRRPVEPDSQARTRRIVEMRRSRCSWAAISKELGISVDAARGRLKRFLEKWGWSELPTNVQAKNKPVD